MDVAEQQQHIILHVGCGRYNPHKLPEPFRTANWREVRLDLDPDVAPDIIASITDMAAVPSQSVDALWSAQNLEHLFAHEVPVALKEFYRVLKPGGFAIVNVPDLQDISQYIVDDQLEEPAYQSADGPISPIDVLFGHRPPIAKGNHFMAHKTGFTAKSLRKKLEEAGFAEVDVNKTRFNLWAIGYKGPVRQKLSICF